MKPTFTVLSILLLILSACTKKDIEHTTSLPAATQTGANTFGAMVNGVLFTPNQYTGGFSQDLYAYYNTPIPPDTEYLDIDAADLVNTNNGLMGHFEFELCLL